MLPCKIKMVIIQELPNGDMGGEVMPSLSVYNAISELFRLTTAEERYEIYRHLQNEFEERIKKQREQEYGEVAGHS